MKIGNDRPVLVIGPILVRVSRKHEKVVVLILLYVYCHCKVSSKLDLFETREDIVWI